MEVAVVMVVDKKTEELVLEIRSCHPMLCH